MNEFKTPEEAIAASNMECENAWIAFSDSNKIKEVQDPIAYKIAKGVFRAGYMNGAIFVTNYVTGQLMKKNKNNDK